MQYCKMYLSDFIFSNCLIQKWFQIKEDPSDGIEKDLFWVIKVI